MLAHPTPSCSPDHCVQEVPYSSQSHQENEKDQVPARCRRSNKLCMHKLGLLLSSWPLIGNGHCKRISVGRLSSIGAARCKASYQACEWLCKEEATPTAVRDADSTALIFKAFILETQ